jgi:lysozyme
MTTPYLAADIKTDEGLRTTAYQDGGGVWTIGYGHTAGVKPGQTITPDEALTLLAGDLNAVQLALDKQMPWWRELNDPRQDVVVNMSFNLGVGGVLRFTDTIADVEAALRALGAAQGEDYAKAASDMLQSKWAREVGLRAVRLAAQMREGVRQDPASFMDAVR